MTDDLVTWLRAQLDDDEQAVRAATPGPWEVDNEEYAETVYGAEGVTVVSGGRWGGEASVFDRTEDALHIARHDPARVLREVEADRALLGEYEAVADMDTEDAEPEFAYGRAVGLGVAVRYRALRFADRPGYREEWKP